MSRSYWNRSTVIITSLYCFILKQDSMINVWLDMFYYYGEKTLGKDTKLSAVESRPSLFGYKNKAAVQQIWTPAAKDLNNI